MLHIWNCKQCGQEFETSCFSMQANDKGEFVFSHTIPDYRERLDLGLCTSCYKRKIERTQ